jgi:prepilin-type processing-associated H-X9-DG protein
MRQIGLAIQMYAHNHQGAAPLTAAVNQRFTMGSDSEATLGGVLHWWQFLQVNNYLPGWDDPERSPAVCPASSENRGRGYPYPWLKNLANCSYGINPYMSYYPAPWATPGFDGLRGHKPPKYNRVKNSSEKILLAETVGDGDWPGYFILEWWPNQPSPQWGAGPHNWDWARHTKGKNVYEWEPRGQSNVLWVDGHVTSVRQGRSDFTADTDISSPEDWWVGAAIAAKGERQWKNKN